MPFLHLVQALLLPLVSLSLSAHTYVDSLGSASASYFKLLRHLWLLNALLFLLIFCFISVPQVSASVRGTREGGGAGVWDGGGWGRVEVQVCGMGEGGGAGV